MFQQHVSNFRNSKYSSVPNRRACTFINFEEKFPPAWPYLALHVEFSNIYFTEFTINNLDAKSFTKNQKLYINWDTPGPVLFKW